MGALARSMDRDSPLQPGDSYGDFQILDVLGVGAFAWVYSARSAAFPDPVALKVSKMPVVSGEQKVRARREIRILTRISNANTVAILDHGTGPDDRSYMVMELLEGGELSALHDFDQPLPADEAMRIAYQACLGLVDAHRIGIVHRDIKPSNLWRLPSGDIKVIDFGLARSWSSDTVMGANATQGNVLVGTPHYAQPEQVQTGRLTPASDVYSVAFLLYELLTGRTPLFADRRCSQVRNRLSDDPMGWLSAHVERTVVPLEHYEEGRAVPAELRSLVMQCLAKDPAKRPLDATDLATRLRWLLPPKYGGFRGTKVLVLQLEGSVARQFAVPPGRHRIGLGKCCDLELEDDPVGWVWAEVWWAGPKRDAVLEPVRTDGWVTVDGVEVAGPTDLPLGSILGLGSYMLTVSAREAS